VTAFEATSTVQCTVNGHRVQAEVPVRLSLADFLREHLGLTGTTLGCEHGVCGCCNVLLNGKDVRSCLLFAVQVDGQVLGPPMAFLFYREISDSDLEAIVAYLKSVPPVRNEVPRTTFRIPLPESWGPPRVGCPRCCATWAGTCPAG
jgi:hypothetical protein